MINYLQLNILDMLEFIGEDSCQNILSSFICPLNPDVEDFLHTKAIPFARQHIAVTYLVFAEQNNQKYLVGYYTLANKFICVNSSVLSKTLQKKIAKFTQYDATLKQHMISMPLIAQLGKNFASNIPLNITGSDLLEMALNRVLSIEHLIGGKTVYIECNNHPKLFSFYSSAGFFPFQERIRQPSGENNSNPPLVQMLKYFHH